jgi:hypothetical protein
MPKEGKEKAERSAKPYARPVDAKPADDGERPPVEARDPVDRESDPRRLEQRLKQVDFGKNTIGYDNYSEAVPRAERVRAFQRGWHPRTPDHTVARSKRSWDGIVQKWRRQLHLWDDLPAEDSIARGGDGGETNEWAETQVASVHKST